MRKALVIATLVLMVIFYYWGIQHYEDSQKLMTITSYSHSGSGLSVFLDVGQNYKGEIGTKLLLKPLLEGNELYDFNALFILSPSFTLTKRQKAFVVDFVREGGLLVLSWHDKNSSEVLSSYLNVFQIQLKSKENQSFQNQQTVTVTPQFDRSIFKKAENYHFYSQLLFDEEDCVNDSSLGCFVQSFSFGQGEILVLAGVPSFSNGLLQKGDNKLLAKRLLEEKSPIGINEYVHHFTDRHFLDLFELPSFILPLVGLIVSLILYYLFAHTAFHETSKRFQLKNGSKSLHHVGQALMLGLVEDSKHWSDALTEHKRFLQDLIQKGSNQIERDLQDLSRIEIPQLMDKNKFIQVAGRLISFHQNFLKRKGGFI